MRERVLPILPRHELAACPEAIGDGMKNGSTLAESAKWWYSYGTLPKAERTKVIANRLRNASRLRRVVAHVQLNFGLVMIASYAASLLLTPLLSQLHYVVESGTEFYRITGHQMSIIGFFLVYSTAFVTAFICATLTALLIETVGWTNVMSPVQAKYALLARMVGAFIGPCLVGLFMHQALGF